MRGEVVNLNIKAFNKQHSGLIVKCLKIPHYAYSSRCASAKKKTPTMEILPDKKELIMKGGTFQEQLSAFQ